jgi:hypothetical protein
VQALLYTFETKLQALFEKYFLEAPPVRHNRSEKQLRGGGKSALTAPPLMV